jgi:UDP-N-acetylmuramyl pentapeptide phosphotransferase/UDP-N-acetylglucosamine-1-phosphate transferase
VVAAILSLTLIAGMLRTRRLALPLDLPNERSLHTRPVPRTGGIGILAGSLAGLALADADLVVPLCALGLGLLSFADDRKHVPIALRFAGHGVAAAVAVLALVGTRSPLLAAVLVLATMWMTNLYNFMDGSDGLAGGMAVFGFGAYAFAAVGGGHTALALGAASVAAAAAAFLAFNYPPARIFMGDVGSVPLGFLAAALGIAGWQRGVWPSWFPVLVFSPFIVDATVTLAQRAARGERVWQAHRSHYYQRLVQLGWGHARTARAEYALMAACALGALAALHAPATVQAALLAAAALGYAALAAAVDRAWARRREGAA